LDEFIAILIIIIYEFMMRLFVYFVGLFMISL